VVKARKAHCFFEGNYLADIDTVMNGLSVRRVRETLGEALAKELRLQDIDLVTFLPRSPEVAARRYAESLGLPFRPVFYKMRGERSFQGSTKDERKSSIVQNLHLLPNVEELMGKVLVTIDDSIVRGNNSRRERGLLYEQAGVSVAHHVNYSPPIGIVGDDGVPRGCLFGVDMPPDDDFIARDRTPEQVSEEMEMPVHYITLEGMLGAFERLGMPREELCYYCIGGPHPFEEVSD
jgi:amidophosphoribosyltransferase